jgi:hypothetical protein
MVGAVGEVNLVVGLCEALGEGGVALEQHLGRMRVGRACGRAGGQLRCMMTRGGVAEGYALRALAGARVGGEGARCGALWRPRHGALRRACHGALRR